ncbi:MAG TPA: isoprenylcysteine carboxylmethyltransferase family protein [Gemmatimonadales bacterium]|nr:isoprenylcysteine carboxylmethyltransferase family protein [Gemmatimonadales bacterium]
MNLAKAARDPWVWGQLALFLIVGVAAPLLPRHVNLGSADFILNRLDPMWIRGVGAGILAVGAFIIVFGMRDLGPNLTPGIEPLAGGDLVTSGAYAYVRHPIYAGVVLLLAGYTLVWSNWTLAIIVGFVAYQYFQAKAAAEEKWLVERFPGYRSYMRRVPRRVL